MANNGETRTAGDPQTYSKLLAEKWVDEAQALGGMVEIMAGDVSILLSDGVGLRYHGQNESRPKKHHCDCQITG
jgi:formamidopyrimidine-DNA glycosylase